MASSSAIIIQESGLKGVLTTAFSATATSLTVQFIDIQTGLPRTPQSGTLLFTIDQDNANFETILASSHSTSSGITTITIATNGRGLPKFGSGVGSATGVAHIAGAAIGCVDIAYPINLLEANKLNIDNTNSMTSGLPLAALTTAQMNALTPANGWVIYNSDAGEGYIFQAGSWQPLSSGSTQPNASETVAGKVELATNAEMGTGTSTGGTGARLVPPNDQLVKTSSGLADANKLAVLGDNGIFDGGFMGGLNRNFVLNENISQGIGVKIVSNSGAKSAIASSTVTQLVGAETAFEAGTATNGVACFDSDSHQFVAVWDEAGTTFKYVVGSVSNTINDALSIGSPGTIASIDVAGATVGNTTGIVYDTLNKRVVAVYADATNSKGTAVVGSVSGTVVTWGTPVNFDAAAIIALSVCFDSVNSKIVIAYRDAGDSNKGKVIIGTVSGTTISFGTEVQFSANAVSGLSCRFDSTNGKAVIFYTDDTDTNKGKAIVGTVSGTSISFGAEATFDSADLGSKSAKAAAFDSINGVMVCIYANGTTSLKGIVGTVSGTSISFGSAATVEAGNMEAFFATIGAVYDPAAGKVLVSYCDQPNSDADISEGTVSGTSVTFSGTNQALSTATSLSIGSCYDNFNRRVIATYINSGSDQSARAITVSGNRPDMTNFIGVAQTTGTTGQTKNVALIGGICSGFTGKTPGQAAYLAANGAIITTPDLGSLQVGNFISATELLVKKPNNI